MASPEALTVLVDMDGVLADFDAEVLNRLRERHPHVPLLGTRTNFYISHDYPEHRELVLSISDEPGFFDGLPLVDNALEGWQRVIDFGYHPRVCSSPITTNPTCTIEKRGWLERHFGPEVADGAIITKSKHEHDAVALIDDKPEVASSDKASWQHVVFDKPYNQGGDKLRIDGWTDPRLEEQLARATELYKALGNTATS